MKLFFKSLYKKRVVSTLFLYLLILNCDFESPQKWEKPTWYLPMTIPLINETYTFEGLVDSAIIFSDSINNVIQIVFSDTLPKNGIPDETFNIDMSSSGGLSAPELSFKEINYNAPELPPIAMPPIEIPNPAFNNLLTELSSCFPPSMLLDLQNVINDASDSMVGEIPIDTTGMASDDISIKKIIITEGTMVWKVTNNWSVPIKVVFELKNAGKDFFKSPSIVIKPYTIADPYTEIINNNNNKIIDFENPSFNYSVSVSIIDTLSGPDNGGCEVWSCNLIDYPALDKSRCDEKCINIPGGQVAECTTSADGWTINSGNAEKLTFEFNANFTTIGAIVADINIPIPPTEPISIDIPAMEGISITRAKFDTTSANYPNQFTIDISNGFYKDLNMTMSFSNIFNYELDNNEPKLTEALTVPMVIKPGETLKEIINISEKFLAYGPDSDQPVESISISYDIGIDSGESDTLNFVDGKLSIGMPSINEIDITNLRLQYIAAVTDTLPFPAIESPPISGIPDGFAGFEFYDIIMQIEFYNEIGIPVGLEMELLGTKAGVLDTKKVLINTQIGAPYEENYGCDFSTTGDTAKTIIKLNKASQTTEYYCSPSGTEPSLVQVIDVTDASIVDLMNFGPENISVGGGALIDGPGILAPGAQLWGEFILIAPLAFIFKEPINIIPAGATAMAPMDPSSSSQVDSALVEAGLNVIISNSSALGGSLSLLVSDSTIFPLFLDSLVTGSWVDQDYIFNTTIWDTLNPPLKVDSIYFQSIDPNAAKEDRQALKVEFYNDSTLQFFVGRMFDLSFSATDSVEYNLGYINPDFPELNTSTLVIDKTRMNWVLSEENRYNIAMINFDKSIVDPRDTTQLVPLTFQTTNFLDVQAYLTLMLNVGQLGRETDIIDE